MNCPNCKKGVNVLPNMKKTTCKHCGVPFDIPPKEAPKEEPKTPAAAPAAAPAAEPKKEEPSGQPKYDLW